MSIATNTRRPGAARAALVAAIASVSLVAAAVPANAVDRSRVVAAAEEMSAVRTLFDEDNNTMMALDQSALDSDIYADLLTKPKSELVRYAINRRDSAAQLVKEFTGYDPRVQADQAYLTEAVNDWEAILDNQMDPGSYEASRQWFDSIDYQFLGDGRAPTRELTSTCGACARIVVMGAGGAAVVGYGGAIVNGRTVESIISASIGLGVALVVALVAAYYEVAGRFTAERLRQLDRTSVAQVAMMSTLALTAAEEGRRLAQQNAASLRQLIDQNQADAQATSTIGGRLYWMVRGNGRPRP